MNVRRAVVGVDHGGFRIKELLISNLKSRGIDVTDMGVFTEDSVDYPDVAKLVCRKLIDEEFDLAILACGTGIGISISANKIPGVRCALVHDLFTAEMAAAHNKANALAFGGRITYQVPIEAMLDMYLQTEFLGDRHDRRVSKIADLERQSC